MVLVESGWLRPECVWEDVCVCVGGGGDGGLCVDGTSEGVGVGWSLCTW